jgi:hypothetical protein
LTKIAKRSESNGPAAAANGKMGSPSSKKPFIKIKKIQIDPKEKAAENELLQKMKMKISVLDRKLSASKELSQQARTLTENNDSLISEIGDERSNRRRCESQ